MKCSNKLNKILKRKVFGMWFMSAVFSVFPALAYKWLQLSNNAVILDEDFMQKWRMLLRDKKIFVSIRDAYNIYFHLGNAVKVGGAIAEFGVYQGGTSKLICEYKSNLPFYIFDTFEGMPAVDKTIDLHSANDFSNTSLEQVQEYLKNYNNIHFFKGIFPQSTNDIPQDLEFCFVHLDVDIYESTLAALDYFYPRLKRGGVIISHDYNSISCPGVKKAFTEYFKDKNVEVTFLWDTQALVKKI